MNGPALFLSYNSVDRPAVLAVQKLLAARSITTFLDRDQLAPGLPWPKALEDGLCGVRAVAVFIGRELGGWQKREMYFALDCQVREEKQGHSFPVIPVLLPGADLTPAFLFLNTWIDLRSGLDSIAVAEPLQAFERAIATAAPATASAADRSVTLCPYRGLEAFREEHTAFFAGRTAFASELFKFTLVKELVAVVGPSGSGKSSVVQAGLVPLLRRQVPPATTWDVVAFTPGPDPFQRFASCLAPLLEPDLSETDRLAEAQKLGERLANSEIKLESAIDRAIEKSNGTGRLLVVADQFEELFTLTPESKRRPFAGAWVRALGKARFTLLVTLRADFYSQIIALDRELSDRLAPAQVNVGALTANELRESITGPARLVGLELEPGLADRILHDVGSEPGNLPLLEFALTGLWSRRQGRSLTNLAYDEIGGVTGALTQRAEAEFARFGPQEQTAVRRLFSRLVRVARPEEGAEDTRQRIELQATDPVAEKVAQALAGPEVRLLVMGHSESTGLNEGRTVEVAHEALIRNWERLRGWLNEDREFLLWRQRMTIQQDQWEQHEHDSSYLLRGMSLFEAERWLIGRPQDLIDDEQQFIAQSVELRQRELEAEEQRRQVEIENANLMKEAAESRAVAGQHARQAAEQLREKARSTAVRFRWYSLGLAVMLLIALGATWFAFKQQWLARKQQLIAESRALASQSLTEINSSPQRSVLMGLESISLAREIGVRDSDEELTLLHQLLSSTGGTPFGRPEASFSAVAVSPKGGWFVTGDEHGHIQVFDMRSPRENPLILSTADLKINLLAVSGNERWLVGGEAGRAVLLWDLNKRGFEPFRLELLSGNGAPFNVQPSFSADGNMLALASNAPHGRVQVYELSSGAPSEIALVEIQNHWVQAIALSPDGRLLAYTQTSETWICDLMSRTDVASEPKRQKLGTGDNWSNVVAFSPDGNWVVSSDDSYVRLWHLSAASHTWALSSVVLRSHTALVLSAVFSHDSLWLATGSSDQTVRLWNLSDLVRPPIVLRGHESSIEALAFSADDQQLITGSKTEGGRTWTIPDPAADQVSIYPLDRGAGPFSAAFSPDSRWIAVGSDHPVGEILLWDLSTSPISPTQLGTSLSKRVSILAFSPKRHWLAVASEEDTVIHLWDVSKPGSMSKEIPLRAHRGVISALAFDADGARLASAGSDGTIRLWNLNTLVDGSPPSLILETGWWARSIDFSKDSEWIVAGGEDGTVRMWDLSREPFRKQAVDKVCHKDVAIEVGFSPNRRWLGVSCWNVDAEGNATVVNVKQFESPQIIHMVTFRGRGNAQGFSPDSRWFAAGSWDSTIALIDLNSDFKQTILRGHTGLVSDVLFSRDGRMLASVGDGTARLWNPTRLGAAPTILQGHGELLVQGALSPDGRWLATVGAGSAVQLWYLRVNDLIGVACQTAGRNLTMTEWKDLMGPRPYRRTCDQVR